MNEPQQNASGAGNKNAGQSTAEALLPPEPGMLRFAHIVWRHRYLIASGSLLPAMVLAVAIHLLPTEYTTTLVYERPLGESEYNTLLRRFYSSENLGKIVQRLADKEIADYAARLEQARTETALENLIRFQASPSYPTRLQTADAEMSEFISRFKAQLLHIQITGDSKDDMPSVKDVVTDNWENVLPLYDIRNDLKVSVREFTERVAEIEDSRFTRTIDLQREKARLEKLSGLREAASEAVAGNVMLQFTDVNESQAFLPLPYQRRAAQSRMIDLQEALNRGARLRRYYLKTLTLNEQLLDEIEKRLPTYYTVQQFLGFLDERLSACQEEGLADYLRSYIRKTRNVTLVNTRAGQDPAVYPVSKRLVRRSVPVWIILLMVMTFIAMALECGKERRGHVNSRSGAQRPGG